HGSVEDQTKPIKYNFTNLNTDTNIDDEHQDRMVSMTRTAKASDGDNWYFSYTPLNAHGRLTHRNKFPSSALLNAAGWSNNPFDASSRARQSVRAGMAFSKGVTGGDPAKTIY